MPTLKFITEIIPKKNQILVTSPKSPLGVEIITQLQNHSSLELIPAATLDPLPSVENLSVVVHILTTQSEHLSQILFTTVHLYHLLELAKKHNAQLILLLPHSSDPLFRTSVSLVTQFSKSNKLRYQVIEYNQHSAPGPISDEVIRKFIHGYQYKPKSIISHPQYPKKIATKNNSRLVRSTLLIVAILGTILVVYPLSNILVSRYYVNCTFNNLANQQVKYAQKCSSLAATSLQALDIYTQIIPPYKYVSQQFSLPVSESKLLMETLSSNLLSLFSLVDTISSSVHYLTQTSIENSSSSLLPIMLTTNNESFAQLNNQLINYFQLPNSPSSKSHLVMNTIQVLRRQLIQLSQIPEKNYQTLFREGEYKVLFVIHNHFHPKPNGGVPDTLILVTVSKGHISQTQIVSVKDSDTRLVGQVSPPADFQALTGQSSWRLADANWDPNFPVTADRYAWFVTKELSFTPDLVIAANSNSLKGLLGLIHKYRVGDATTISVQSFNNQMLKFTSSPSPITSLIKSLNYLPIAQNIPLLSDFVISSLFDLDDRQIFIYPTTKLFSDFKKLPMTGEIRQDSCLSDSNCLNEYFYATNTVINSPANLSAPALKTHLEKRFASSHLSSTYELRYEYPDYSKSETQTISSYFRIYLPQNADINLIQINGSNLNQEKYTLEPYGNLNLLSFEVQSEISSPLHITISTTRPLLATTSFSYQLQINNQSGILEHTESLQITYPADWSASAFQTPSLARSGLLRYNTLTNSDYPLRLNLFTNNE